MKVLKVIKSIVTSILGFVFFVFALGMTVLLLSYNDYGLSEFGNKTLILMTDDIYSENYKKGDLVVVEKRGFSRTGGYTDVIEQGDEIFAIRVDAYGNAYVEIGVVGKIYEDEQAIAFENGSTFGLKFVLGEAVDTYPNIGGLLSIVESKWGFLFLVLVPCFLIFMYEIYSLIIEIKYGKEE